MPQDKTVRVVDIGCGYGEFLFFLEKEGYVDSVGVDVSREQVELGKAALGLGNIYCSDLVEFLDQRPRQFGCITALDVLEHFRKGRVLEVLDSVHRALVPDGVFIMKSPNAESPFAGRSRYGDFTHELAFTRRSVNQVLSLVGFEDIQVFPVEPVPSYSFSSTGRWLVLKLLNTMLRLYLAAETGCLRGHILTQNLMATAKTSK